MKVVFPAKEERKGAKIDEFGHVNPDGHLPGKESQAGAKIDEFSHLNLADRRPVTRPQQDA